MTAFTCSSAVGWRSLLKRPGYIYAVVHNTTVFNIEEPYLLSTNCVLFVWLSEQTTIISLYGIKLLVVRQGVCLLRGTSSVLRTRRQPGSIPSMSIGYCGGQSNTFFSRVFQFSLSVSCHQCSIFIFIYILLIPVQTAEGWEHSESNAALVMGERRIKRKVQHQDGPTDTQL